MTKRNAIIEADEQEDSYSDTSTDLNDAEEGDEEFGPDDNELTDEDIVAEAAKMDAEAVARANKSRQRGRAKEGPQRGRTTPQRAAAKDRNPERERQLSWSPTESLEAPPARPGMEQRWIRHMIGSEADPKNLTKKLRNYWSPRSIDTVSEGYFPPTIKHAQLGSIIGVGDLILCERPKEVGISRRKYFANKLRMQTAAGQRHVRNVEQEGHEITVTNQRSRPTVGRGSKRRVRVQDDGE